MLYVKLRKALYGTLQAALVEWGFKLNKYNKCMANKLTNGKQCTIIWHVDDLKISHVDHKVMEEVIIRQQEIWTRKPTCDITGQSIGIPGDISMYKYTNKMLAGLPSGMNQVSMMPAALNLFNVNDSKRS